MRVRHADVMSSFVNGGCAKPIPYGTVVVCIECKHVGLCAIDPIVIGKAEQAILVAEIIGGGVEGMDSHHVIVLVIRWDVGIAVDIEKAEELGKRCEVIVPAIVFEQQP